MPLRFPKIATIRSTPAWHDALVSDLFGFGSVGPDTVCESAEMFATMQAVRRWSMRSPTAQKVLNAIDNSGKVIHVIGMKSGGYTCFDNDCPRVGEGTCYVDVEAYFYADVGGTKPLHNYIVILHELGHAVQWIESPGWFAIAAGNKGRVDLKDIQRAAIGMRLPKPMVPKVINPPEPESGEGGPPPPPPGPIGGPSGPTPEDRTRALGELGLQGYVAPGHKRWPFIIEQDNMARHEWPICREARYECRPGYAHIKVAYPRDTKSPFMV